MKNEKDKLSKTEKVMYSTDSFIQRNAKKIIGISIAIVVVVILVAVIAIVTDNNSEKTYAGLYDLESSYNNILVADKSSEEYATLLSSFYSDAETYAAENKIDSYEGAKARLMFADLKFDDGDYSTAYDTYMEIAAAHSDDYFAPLCLMNAAASAENMGNQDEALDLYTQVWDVYGKDAPEAPKALFSQARIIEAQGDVELASSIYNQLADEFSSSYYSALAQAKLLTI